MTSFVATPSTLASSLVYGTCSRINRVNQFATPQYIMPIRLQRNATSLVRCMARDNEEEQKTSRTSPPLRPALEPKVGANFSDFLAFDGPAPERINGRLAMIGFVAALTVELSNGQDVFAQISNGGIPWFVGTSVVLTLASLIPLFKGVSVESKSKGIMTSDAEMWNGRFAMLGLVALAFTEFVKGGTLV